MTLKFFLYSADLVKVYESSVFEEPCRTLMKYLHYTSTLNNYKKFENCEQA